jgi:hypothetical protein
MRAQVIQETPLTARPSWPELYEIVYLPVGALVETVGGAVRSARTYTDPETVWLPIQLVQPTVGWRYTQVTEERGAYAYTAASGLGVSVLPADERPGSARPSNSPALPRNTQVVARAKPVAIKPGKVYYTPQKNLRFLPEPIVIAPPPPPRMHGAVAALAGVTAIGLGALLARAAR